MILEYKLSNSQRRKYIFLPLMKLLAVIVIATIVGVRWFDIRTGPLQMVIGLTWSWVFLMHLLPLMILVVRHHQLSSGSSFAIDTSNNTYHYKGKDVSLSFRLNEIDKVIKVVSPPKYDKRMDILGFGYFFYWKIRLADSRTLAISCMLLDADDFSGKEATQEKRLFPIPPSNRDFRLPPNDGHI
jgi:hypothetical protein